MFTGTIDLNEHETPESVKLPIETRVKQGMMLLDEKHGPEWVFCIDVDALDISLTCSCIVGQLYGGKYESFGNGLVQLERVYDGIDYGFLSADCGEDYPSLTVAWREAILRRRLELSEGM